MSRSRQGFGHREASLSYRLGPHAVFSAAGRFFSRDARNLSWALLRRFSTDLHPAVQEDAQHPEQLVGPVDRTQGDMEALEQLADGSYRGVFPISDSPFHSLLSCGYHNGEWTLSTDEQPVRYTWFDGAGEVAPAAVTVEHQNLLIKDVSPEYIVFNPEESSTVSIGYTLDKLVTENCAVTINIYTSSQALVRTLTMDRTCSSGGSAYTETWDGKDTSAQRAPIGVYLFALEARAENGDCDQSVSETLSIVSTGVEVISCDTLRVRYSLVDSMSTPASSARVQIYSPSLALVGTANGPTALGEQSTDVSIPRFDEVGRCTCVVLAADNTAAYHKGHRTRPALPRNWVLPIYRIFLDPGHGGDYEQVVAYCQKRSCCDCRPLVERQTALAVADRACLLLWSGDYYYRTDRGPCGEQVLFLAPPRASRRADYPVHLRERVLLAARADSHVFVSLHSNAGSASARGHVCEYCELKPLAGLQDRWLASRTNLHLNWYVEEIPQYAAGVYEDDDLSGFHVYVLRRTYKTIREGRTVPIPATLVELGFHTNETDAQYLQSDDVRDKLAYAVIRAADIFLQENPQPY